MPMTNKQIAEKCREDIMAVIEYLCPDSPEFIKWDGALVSVRGYVEDKITALVEAMADRDEKLVDAMDAIRIYKHTIADRDKELAKRDKWLKDGKHIEESKTMIDETIEENKILYDRIDGPDGYHNRMAGLKAEMADRDKRIAELESNLKLSDEKRWESASKVLRLEKRLEQERTE